MDGKTVSLGDRISYALGDLMIFGPLRNTLGLLARARRLHRGRGDRA